MSKNVSILSKDIIINGNIVSDGVIDVNGRFDGTIVSAKVAIKNNGNVNGNVYANEIIMSNGARIDGSVQAGKITMYKNSVIEGDVSYCSVSIEETACIVGTCTLISEDKLMEVIEKKKNDIATKQNSK